MRVALAGGGLLAGSLLSALLDSHHQVVALVQDGRKTRGIRRIVTPAIESMLVPSRCPTGLAKRNRIPIVYIDKMNEAELAPLRAIEPDLLLVGGFSIILKQPLLSLPRLGCLNAHSSLLPRHRGPNPFTAVLLAGESETGVTFHVMEEGIDTGDIVAQFAFPIAERDNASDVHQKSCDVAMTRVVEVIDQVERVGLRGTPQDPESATYDRNVKIENSFVDWKQDAKDIDRMVRALFPYVFARCRYRGSVIHLYRTSFNEAPTENEPGVVIQSRPRLKVATGRGSVTIEVAFRKKPIPWVWPPLLHPPKRGDRLD